MSINRLRLLLATGMGMALLMFSHQGFVSAQETVSHRVIVQVDGKGKLDEAIETIASNHNQTVYTLEVPDNLSTAAFIKELEQEEHVLHVEEDQLLQLTYAPYDVDFFYQYHHSIIHTDEVWDRTMGSGVTVAILDNGIDPNHYDLKWNIVDPYDVVYESPYTLSPGEHGTHVAGIVASQIDNYYGGVGVAPAASIMPIDVFAGTYAYTSDVIEGVYRAVDQGADIINMSLGSYNYSSLFQEAIHYAYENDVVVVAAAGNDASTTYHYPSSYNHVISVGSTTRYDSLSSFSNYGWQLDIVAPGSSIYSTTPYNTYGSMSGTSMASPVVAGVVALLKSSEPSLTVDDITERLTSTADDLGSYGWDYYYSSGRINAKSALNIRQLEPVLVDELTDASDTITGVVPATNGAGTVEIFDIVGNRIGAADDLTGGDRFSVKIPKQQAGTTLQAVYSDSYGNASPAIEFIVIDRTPPTMPTVSEFSDQATTVKGNAEAYSTVSVTANGTEIGTGLAGGDGTFQITVPKQRAGTALRVIATDIAGNSSPAMTIQVVDRTAPSLLVDPITNQSTTIRGKSEPGAKIQMTYKGQKRETTTDSTGGFTFSLASQRTGETLRFIAIDAAGNQTKGIDFVVRDAIAPVINGVANITVEAKGTFDVKHNVTVKDETDGDITTNLTVSGTVNVGKPGVYTLTYSVKDRAGNESRIIRKVTVKDSVKPVMYGVGKKTIAWNSRFDVRKGVTARDNVSGDLTKSIQVLGAINVKKVGTYTLTYKVRDAAGNTTTLTRKITVKDTVKPVISGVKSKAIKYKSRFNPMTGVIAKDNADGTLTKSVKVSGKVNTKRKGVYPLTYTVKDRSGNVTFLKVKITVK